MGDIRGFSLSGRYEQGYPLWVILGGLASVGDINGFSLSG